MSRSILARPGALAAAAIALLGACGGGDGTTATPSTTVTAPAPTTAGGPGSTLAATTTTGAVRLIEVAYAGGQVAGGAQRTTVRLGERVRIRVTSDVADEVHVHTYDLKAAVAPGQPAEVELVASIPGRHEVELEKKHRQLLVLEVR